MRRFDQVTPEEMPEVVRVASRLYEEERAATQEQQSTIQAASELDLPPEYLERAADRVHADRVAQIQAQRKKRNTLLATVGAVVVLGGGWVVTHPKPPAPVVMNFDSAPQTTWGLNMSPGSSATVTYPQEAGHGTVAQVQVTQFAGGSDGFVNLDSNAVPHALGGYKTVSFQVRGAGLTHIRLALENGNERSRSPVLPVTGEWKTFRLPLNELDRQTRASGGGKWHNDGTGAPRTMQRLSFKLGAQVNDPKQQGTVAIDDVRFE